MSGSGIPGQFGHRFLPDLRADKGKEAVSSPDQDFYYQCIAEENQDTCARPLFKISNHVCMRLFDYDKIYVDDTMTRLLDVANIGHQYGYCQLNHSVPDKSRTMYQ